MAAVKKYLTIAEITNIIGTIIIDDSFVPMSQDTYNETAVFEAIVNTKRANDLAMAAINLACVGYGSKKYGIYKHKDTMVDIGALLNSCQVKTGLGKDAKLSENDLTPMRLCRAFRHQIREYIQVKKFETYLFRKYSDHNVQFADVCFRGSEYLDNLKKEECDYLLLVYAKLDSERGTNVLERIKRIFQAKGYIGRTFMSI